MIKMEPDIRFSGWPELSARLSNVGIVCSDNVEVVANLAALAAASQVVRTALADLPGLHASDISIVMPEFPSAVVRNVVNYFLGQEVFVSGTETSDFFECLNQLQATGAKLSKTICPFCQEATFPKSMVEHLL